MEGIPFAPFMDPWVMLKKQFLDDKTVAAAASPTLMPGVPPTGGGGNASSGVDIVSAFHRQGTPAITGTNHASDVVQPPPPPAPVVTAAAKGKTTPTLTGQAWYSQSAGRAVNQVNA